ncbi:protein NONRESPONDING TO OXYLIPINS 2, mitochondrial isoform X2 [Populus trichocarpa]|uniref:Uncharacterized protein n=1 Tax=Populus trichocarpa TaxID=3694 RepID=A0A3N7GAA5_POPTR|nr:protein NONRESPONDING TO OXYLIPINS 2, mitochondrial isoform X2 [Populus trichocarpa]|eukprot:XP_024455464.1 uncharacterized protein LOC7461219 isoform X2 [Populus trichocarpa]
MASFCRSAMTATTRSLASLSKTAGQKTLYAKSMSSPFTSTPTRTILATSRIVSVLGSVESLMPLHSAIANARLKSSIAVDSSCWSWLSQAEYSNLKLENAVPRINLQLSQEQNLWTLKMVKCHGSMLVSEWVLELA